MNTFLQRFSVVWVVRVPPGGRQGFGNGPLAVLLFLLLGATAGAAPRAEMAMLGGRPDFQAGQLPPGRLQSRLEGLPAPARERALAWMRDFSFPEPDTASIHLDDEGGVFYVCQFPVPEGGEAGEVAEDEPVVLLSTGPLPVSPFPEVLKFHSRPGAPNVIFLDVDGAVVSGTAWNNELGRDSIVARAFSSDTDETVFSEVEQARILEIWLRVAEDYAAYNVNVTTEEPAVWNNRVAHVVIIRNTDVNGALNPYSTAGGVAYVNVFNASNFSYYRPAWVYANNLSFNAGYIAEAASHEAGHNLGLSHDGLTTGVEYYGGHGSGDTSWGTIMGSSYNRNITQWSKGEYYLANNTQDDLAIIAGKLGYRAPDHGSTFPTASFLSLSDGTNVVSVSPTDDPAGGSPANKGVIEGNTDVDVFSFTTGSGPVFFRATPWIHPTGVRGNNLDLRLRVYTSGGALVAESNPASLASAELSLTLDEGTYALEVAPVGTGSPQSSPPTGYTGYGSLGQYFLSGWVTDPSGVVIPPQAELSATSITTPGQTQHLIQVLYSDNVAIDVSTLGSDDVLVLGPNNVAQAPTLVSVDVAANGTPRLATYRVDPPDGDTWTAADNGLYSVIMNGESVFDVEGAPVAPAVLGSFLCEVPVVVYEALMDVNPGWTLAGGWQYGAATGSGGNPPSGATGSNILGYNLSGNYTRNLALTYATSPAIPLAGVENLVVQYQRWLGVNAQGTANVQVSVNGGAWTTIWQSSGEIIDTAWTPVQHDVTSLIGSASSIQLRFGMGSGNRPQTSFGWNLDDVRWVGTVADAIPPGAELLANDVTAAGAPYHEVSVVFTDNVAVAVSSLSDNNLEVIQPDGATSAVFYVGTDLPGDGTPRIATYRIPPPNGSWASIHNGDYTVRLVDSQVSDPVGNVMASRILGSFLVDIPEPSSEWTLVVGVNDPALGEVDAPAGTTYPSGTQITLSAIPSDFVDFSAWSGDVAASDNPLVFVLTNDVQVTAVFTPQTAGDYATPVWWLVEQGVTNDFDAAAETQGANGLPLWASYIAGLDPSDPASRFDVSVSPPGDVFSSGGGLVLTWSTVTGRVYTVLRSDDLRAGFAPAPGGVDLPWTQSSFTGETSQAGAGYSLRVRLAE